MTFWKTWFLHHPTLNKLYLPTSVKRILILLCKPFIPLSWLHPCPKDHCLNELNFFLYSCIWKLSFKLWFLTQYFLRKRILKLQDFLIICPFSENVKIYTRDIHRNKCQIKTWSGKLTWARYIRISPSMLNVLAPCQLKKPNYI